jgi:tRNA(Ile)-lysidine synthase
MLLLLVEENALPRNALGAGLSAVHVHHGLRGAEADADLEFVQALCDRLGVSLSIHRASVPARLARAREEGRPETLEEAARGERYAAFNELLASRAADAIVTAHTLDDQAETVLMKLVRGAWTAGLAGIHPEVLPHAVAAGRIVRPLLHVRRDALRDYLRTRGQPWREDSSNTNEAHTRNRLRHSVLPLLRAENPSIDRTLAQLATLAREDEARWSAELTNLLPRLLLPGRPVQGGGRAVGTNGAPERSVGIELERLRALDPALRRRVLRGAAASLDERLTFEQTARLIDLVGSGPAHSQPAGARSAPRIQLSATLVAERSARELRLHHRRGAKEER